MSAQTIQLYPFQNVVANGTAYTDLRHLLGYSIESIDLVLGGTFTKSMITGYQVKANGKVIIDSNGARTDARMQWRGIAASATFITIDLSELKAKLKTGFAAGVLDTTLGIRDLRLEVTIAGATSPTLAGVAEVCTPLVDPTFAGVRPLVARVHSVTQTIGAAGTFPLIVPHLDPNSGGSIFKRLAIFSSNCTGVRVERNGIREWEMISAAQNNYNAGKYGRVSQAGLFMVDFFTDGFMEDRLLDTRPQSKTNVAAVYGTFSAGETITIESELLEPVEAY